MQFPKENIHRIKGENNPEEEAIRYAGEIKENLNFRGDNPVFDLVILGLGEDGHTASIFPDELELFEDERICAVATHPLSGQKRITITGKVLNNANRVFFLVTGASKSLRISEIMNDDEAAKLLPAYYISPTNGELIWFIDEAAAQKIQIINSNSEPVSFLKFLCQTLLFPQALLCMPRFNFAANNMVTSLGKSNFYF